MSKFEKATIGQMEQDGIALPPKAREELERGMASTVVSRTVVGGEEHRMYTHIHRGSSLVELAERQRVANERRAYKYHEEIDKE